MSSDCFRRSQAAGFDVGDPKQQWHSANKAKQL